MIEPGCIIDGAVPRTPQERCKTLLAYIDGKGQEVMVFQTEIETNYDDEDYEWVELELDIINLLEDTLPDNYYVMLDAGDVLVVES